MITKFQQVSQRKIKDVSDWKKDSLPQATVVPGLFSRNHLHDFRVYLNENYNNL